jgi:bifunctional DNA-binding transcriptional regulator/antitoxin component of YhaV-PrlF toxin-antitoxin module
MAPEGSEIVKIASGGRVRIPMSIAKGLDLKDGDYLALDVIDGVLYATPVDFKPRSYDLESKKP